jgi:ubiquinone/menaquinone biosynthesis C-methylase UbiE
MSEKNLHAKTVSGFGDEWQRFDQTGMTELERERIFNEYFGIFPWHELPADSIGFDLGCGSGRWALQVAPRVGRLHCIDPSVALEVAQKNLATQSNCVFHKASVDAIPLADASMDFGYSLGVLHHVPDTAAGIKACVQKLKPGAPFLVYLYYAFDNKAFWYRWLWLVSNAVRQVVSRLPHSLRYAASQVIALTVYWPLARTAGILEKLGFSVKSWPLSSYRNYSFYTMRTDALDRFGTQLEQRFTQLQIKTMMEAAGLKEVRFSASIPYWCAVGIKA